MIHFTLLPERGDIVVYDATEEKDKYIKLEGFTKAELDEVRYKIKGVVYHRRGNEVRWVLGQSAIQSKSMWSEAVHKIANLTLSDGTTSKIFCFSVREASNNWTTNVPLNIPYTSTTLEGVASEINAFFAQHGYKEEANLGYHASVVDDELYIACKWQRFEPYFNRAEKNADNPNISSSWWCAPEITWSSLPSKSGYFAHIPVANKARAKYYRYTQNAILASPITSYNRDVLSYKDYISDNCAAIRAIFGEGEEGWSKYLEVCKAETTSMRGGFKDECGAELTHKWASHKSMRGLGNPISTGADYVLNLEAEGSPKGSFYLATAKEMCWLMEGIEYPTNEQRVNANDRNADILNRALNAIGKAAIGNSSNSWCASRYYANYGWIFSGYHGYVYGNPLYHSHWCVPVSLSIIS